MPFKDLIALVLSIICIIGSIFSLTKKTNSKANVFFDISILIFGLVFLVSIVFEYI